MYEKGVIMVKKKDKGKEMKERGMEKVLSKWGREGKKDEVMDD